MSNDLLIPGASGEGLVTQDLLRQYSSSEKQVRADAIANTGNGLAAEYIKDAAYLYSKHSHDTFEHYDAAPTIGALARGLELIDRSVTDITTVDKELPKGNSLPIKYENDPLAQKFIHYLTRNVGSWKRGAPSTTDIPLTEAVFEEWSDPSYSYYGGYLIKQEDLAMMVRTGMNGNPSINIPAMKAKAFEQARLDLVNQLMLFGDPQIGLPGWINHPSALKFSVGAITTSTTPESDILILNSIARATQSLELYRFQASRPDSIEMSYSLHQILTSKPYSFIPAGSSTAIGDAETSVLKYFLMTNPHIKTVGLLEDLEPGVLNRFGSPNKQHIIAYQRNPDNLRFQFLTPDVVMLPPKDSGFSDILRVGMFKTAGVLLYRLTAMVVAQLG
jgi:hypothetical protein